MSKPNTSSLQDSELGLDLTSPTPSSVIYIDHVTMVFNMANQQLNSLKEYAIAFLRRELMFKEFVALDDITFNVEKGDVFGILGTNGSGKSTLLKIIAGVLEPTKGSVEIKGSIAPLIELGAGFDHELTARENIYLNGSLLGYSKQFIDEHFDDIVDFAEIGDFLDTPLKNYSSGMIARIAFAIATVIVPEILIVDEVLSVGDFMFQQKCEKMIQSLINEHNVTVLIVSHNNEQIERLCNKAIWIEKGHMRLLGDAKDVCRVYAALGGHAGSKESEEKIFNLLNERSKVETKEFTSIASNTKYGNTAKLVSSCDFSNDEDLILVPGDDPIAQLLGIELSSVLDCPFMTTRTDALSDEVELTIQRYGKRRLIVIEVDNDISQDVIDSIRHACSDIKNIDVINEKDHSTLSHAIVNFINECSLDSKAYQIEHHCNWIDSLAGFVVNAPERYKNGSVTIFDVPDEPDLPKQILEDAFDAEKAPGLFYRSTDNDSTDLVNGVMIANNTSGLYDAISAIPLAAKNDFDLLLLDHNDLDNMVGAIDRIQCYPENVEVTFLGGKWCFNETDKEIISKALA